ncbi:glycosyltransferase family 4 protein [Williamsia herbipolensis]|uniref:Glycosyltransferase family 4 protein n=1 Tax=Williamsia herbipolensis TaxID=1603258 RepID=A0AAU4K6T7_9NOCA|nr:glycosyltransferase family 4 protein [Williamsia herbipolensis]
MRIAIVHSFYASAVPSGENAAVELQVAALRRAGHEVHLLSRNTDAERGRNPRTYAARAAVNTLSIRGASSAPDFSEINPDIIHVHNLHPNFGDTWIDGHRARVVSTLHNYRPVCARGTLWRDGHDCFRCPESTSLHALRHRCYHDSRIATLPLAIASREHGRHSRVITQSAHNIVLNTGALSIFRNYFPGTPFSVIPNFVASPSFREIAPPPTTKFPRWLFAGRLSSEKGIQWLLEHWPPDTALLVAGDGPERPVVEEHARRPGSLISYVGSLSRAELDAYMESVTGVIIPSLWTEGLPTVALEAQACGTPVVISNKCASADQITRHGGGLQFDPTEGIRGLSGSMSQIAGSRGQFSRCARQTFLDHFSEEVWVQRITALYSDIRRRNERPTSADRLGGAP